MDYAVTSLMNNILAILTLIGLLLVIFENRVYRLVIYTGVFSAFLAVIYLGLGSPDVAMAEIAVGAFAIIFFIVISEKFYKKKRGNAPEKTNEMKEIEKKATSGSVVPTVIVGLVFSVVVGAAFLHFAPGSSQGLGEFALRDGFQSRFQYDIGGHNPIAAILMSYRIYDTLFEALLLVIAVTAVGKLSAYKDGNVKGAEQSSTKKDIVVFYSLRIISPLILLFGIYLIMNGHLSAGGGFQGGVAVAVFFVCRYMMHNIYDINYKKILQMEEIVFAVLTVFVVAVVLLNVDTLMYDNGLIPRTTMQNIYLFATNALVGLKVACGFVIIFYRYIAAERK